MTVDVSVVIPTHNSMPWLDETLASVRAQSGVRLEVIAVDDGSTDGTRAWLGAMDDVRLIVSDPDDDSRCLGTEAARANYVAFVDHDDLWAPDKLRLQVEYLDSHPDVVAVGTGCAVFRGSPDSAKHLVYPPISPATLRSLRTGRLAPFPISSVVARRPAALLAHKHTFGLFPKDLAFIAYLARLGAVDRLPADLTYYRSHPGSQSRADAAAVMEGVQRIEHVMRDPARMDWISVDDFVRLYVTGSQRRAFRTADLLVRASDARANGDLPTFVRYSTLAATLSPLTVGRALLSKVATLLAGTLARSRRTRNPQRR